MLLRKDLFDGSAELKRKSNANTEDQVSVHGVFRSLEKIEIYGRCQDDFYLCGFGTLWTLYDAHFKDGRFLEMTQSLR